MITRCDVRPAPGEQESAPPHQLVPMRVGRATVSIERVRAAAEGCWVPLSAFERSMGRLVNTPMMTTPLRW